MNPRQPTPRWRNDHTERSGAGPQTILRLPSTITFGCGTIALLGEIARSEGHRALVCSDPGVAATSTFAQALALLAAAGVSTTTFTEVEPDVPLETVDACVRNGTAGEVDVVVGIGGGSALDTAKLAALQLSHPGSLSDRYGENGVPGPCMPVIAVPTTAGTGSEVSPVAVLHDPTRRMKVGIASRYLIPRVALCDPEATVSCPPQTTAHAGIDALAHALEAYTAAVRPNAWGDYPGAVFRGKNPFSDLFALSAIQMIHRSLERAVNNGRDLDARTDMLFGSVSAGCAFSQAGTAGAHALQYPIGAITSTPHGLGVGVLLPYVLDAIRPAAQIELANVARALAACEADDEIPAAADAAVREITRLVSAVGIPRSLAELGVAENELESIAADASTITRLLDNSPVILDQSTLTTILRNAWTGPAVQIA